MPYRSPTASSALMSKTHASFSKSMMRLYVLRIPSPLRVLSHVMYSTGSSGASQSSAFLDSSTASAVDALVSSRKTTATSRCTLFRRQYSLSLGLDPVRISTIASITSSMSISSPSSNFRCLRNISGTSSSNCLRIWLTNAEYPASVCP